MKRNQLALILVLLAALGGVALFLRSRDSASWSSSAAGSSEKILSFPLNDVSRVTIKTSGTELNLVKQEGTWRVAERADYPADFGKVAGLLRKLWELRATQDVKAGPSQLGRLELLEPGSTSDSGTLIELTDGSAKPLGSLLLGKKQNQMSNRSFGDVSISVGRYVMSPAHAERVYLVAETFDEVQPKPELWLGRDFLKVENPKSIALAGTAPGMNWKVSRQTATGPWTLLEERPGEELDSTKINSLTSYLANLGFADVLKADAPPAETGLDKPSALTIETFDGFDYELRIGKLMGTNYPVLVSVKASPPNERKPAADEKPADRARLDQQFQEKQKQLNEKLMKEEKLAGRPYLVAKGTVQQFLKERSALLKSEPSPAPTAGPSTKPRPTPSKRPK